ncbi:MAG: FAD-linked oxidase C-terminal domain-containing protein [Chloroflexota bacterium]
MTERLGGELLQSLRLAVGSHAVLDSPEELLAFEYDGYVSRALPQAVVQPSTPGQAAASVAAALRSGVPVTARGGGTGLSGGSIPEQGGLLVDLNQMHRILEVDQDNRAALVEPALLNLDLSNAVAQFGLFYAPDPSSQKASTIGGNIAENAGGPHCLSRGTTTNHVLGLQMVAQDGALMTLGGPAPDAPGYDLVGLAVGSEGMFGVVTRAWLRLLPSPVETVTFLGLFDSVHAAGAAVSSIVAHGVVPSALELIDAPSARALEQSFHAGYPDDIGAVLLIDCDGLPESVEAQAAVVRRLCEETPGNRGVRYAGTTAERDLLWKARKGALAAMARIAPNYYLCDGVVPRSRLADVLRRVYEVGDRERVIIASVAHVGDGNLHPLVLYDAREPDVMERVHRAADDIIRLCVEAGGTITGEHGVGIEKRDYMGWMFTEDDLERMRRVRRAFDPHELFNPGKVFPGVSAAAGAARPHVRETAAIGPDAWI